jgi:hypothetical protein
MAWMEQPLTAARTVDDLCGKRVAPYNTEVDGFYWTDPAPDIVNPGREEQGLVSV